MGQNFNIGLWLAMLDVDHFQKLQNYYRNHFCDFN